jgi:hypothetical protein
MAAHNFISLPSLNLISIKKEIQRTCFYIDHLSYTIRRMKGGHFRNLNQKCITAEFENIYTLAFFVPVSHSFLQYNVLKQGIIHS